MYSCTTHVPLDFYLVSTYTQINSGNPTFLLNVSKSISFLILFFLNSIKNWIIQQKNLRTFQDSFGRIQILSVGNL